MLVTKNRRKPIGAGMAQPVVASGRSLRMAAEKEAGYESPETEADKLRGNRNHLT
jgi:hypothetical protein